MTIVNNRTEVREVVVTTPLTHTETLSVMKITDGTGCPERDPATYGVFLRSESGEGAILCYYD